MGPGGKPLLPQPWQDTQRTLLEQLSLQRQVLGLLIFLIVAVAALGVANLLFLKVVEKTPEIALLRAMGASRGTVGLVFALEGAILGVGAWPWATSSATSSASTWPAAPWTSPGSSTSSPTSPWRCASPTSSG